MKPKIRNFLKKLITFFKSYIELSIWLLVFAIGIRFFEAILLCNLNFNFSSSILWNLTGLCYDISLFLRTSIWLLPLFIAVSFITEKITRVLLRVLLSLVLLFSLICVLFFSTSGYLLDNAVFSYTFKEIMLIIKSSSGTPIWVYIIMIALPLLYFYLSAIRIKINNICLYIFVILTLSSFFIFNNLSINSTYYHLQTNIGNFFVKSVFKKRTAPLKMKQNDIIKLIQEFRTYFPEHQFVEPEYPFLYKDVCKDVLSPFLNLKSEPPNIVIIIVEGMGYEHLYNDYQIMPFLDSLSKTGLSWKNCFSAAPRTFGILPALLGNSPLGEKGFLSLCPYNPEFQSLTRILNQNNYTNYFFHGGPSAWIKMDIFSDQNKMTYLTDDEWEQDIKKETIASEWGYEDHLIYKQALRKLNQRTESPRTDIYLSSATHHPWEYPRSAFFQNIVKTKVTQNKTTSDDQKKKILNLLNVYGGYAYADWSLQQLIEGYKKREDFDNTIFIITGDHHAFSKQFAGAYSYHVPLVIFSPMLKSGRTMKGVVTHRDITPTILSLLHNNFNIETPDEVAWLNSGLDTSIAFNANTFSYLQGAHGLCEGIIYKNYLYCEGVLDEFSDTLPRRLENPDPEIVHQMEKLFTLYKIIDNYTLQNDVLLRKTHSKKGEATTVLDIYDTIAAGSYFATRSDLPIMEAPENRKNTLYFNQANKLLINFLNYVFFEDDIEKFSIYIAFKIYLKADYNGEKIQTRVHLFKDNKKIIHKHDYLVNAKPEQWYNYRFSFFCNKDICELFDQGCYLKVFLYNEEQEGYIDDIEVKLIIEKKKLNIKIIS